jgi:hypothetical protein
VNAAQVKRNSPIREVTRRVALPRVSFGLLFSLVCAHSIATPITGAARTSIACLYLKHAFERERETKHLDGSKQERTKERTKRKESFDTRNFSKDSVSHQVETPLKCSFSKSRDM